MAPVREPRKWGKHRTEVTEATEEEFGFGLFGNIVAPVRELSEDGKHRTEITEGNLGGCTDAGGRGSGPTNRCDPLRLLAPEF